MNIIEKQTYNNNLEPVVKILQISNRYLLVLKDKILTLTFCAICSRWRKANNLKDFKKDHIKKCRRCACGTVYKDGEPHDLVCVKKRKADKTPKLESKVFKAEKSSEESNLLNHIHHADFECHREGVNQKFIVNTAVLKKATDEKPAARCGQDALSWFMNQVLEMEGILWFFNGGKFDLYFVLEYCLDNHILIDKTNTLICSNQVFTLGLVTYPPYKKNHKIKTGSLIFKDLAKFCPGSLHFNCENLGIDSSESKGSFDHNKIKTWEDVKKNEKELVEYAILDVVAQSRVYEETAKGFWKDYKLNMAKFVSLAQISYAASTTFMSNGLLFKVPKISHGRENKWEEKLRQAYRGGRIVATVPYWKSDKTDEIQSLIQKDEFNENDFKNINDYLIYYDKVSLYPSVMYAQEYPCGKMTHHKNVSFVDECINQIYAEAEEMKKATSELVKDDHIKGKEVKKYVCKVKSNFKFKWKHTVICIDIDPPTEEHYIAFLMDRDKNGSNIQNLKPKRKYWTTGVELIEAIILGYKLINIYEYFEWAKVGNLFKEFISKAIQNKAEAKKGTAGYLLPKNVMNANSGKWAQRAMKKSYKLYTFDELQTEIEKPSKDTSMLYDETGRVIGALTVVDNVVTTSPYPLQISIFILAYSRELMSQFIRKCNGFINPKHTPIYGDTDSLIMHCLAIAGLDPVEFGTSLGQMKDELEGGKIIACIVLAPKTYMIKWVQLDRQHGPLLPNQESLPKKPNLYIKFVSKGIPHFRDPYNPFDDYTVNENTKNEVLKIIQFQKERVNTKTKYHSVKLGEYYFYKTYQDKEKPFEVKSRLSWQDMEDILHDRANILSLYGGMQRCLTKFETIHDIGINMDYNKRNIVSESWWKKGHRITDESFPYTMTKVNK